jgi:hypothetical protein
MEEIDVISFITDVFQIQPEFLKMPDFIFYVIIPFIVTAYALYFFLNGMKIFRKHGASNKILAVIFTLISLRFLYPGVFVISIFYLVTIKRWPQSLVMRILFLILVGFLYLYLFPTFSNFIQTLT